MDQKYLIALAGPSGVGKSTIARSLQGESISHVSMDDFYKPYETFPKILHWVNCDAPDNIDFDAAYETLTMLRSGKPVTISAFVKDTDKRETKKLLPASLIVVEGFLVLHDERLRNLFDLKIFLDCPVAQQRDRRERRDPIFDPAYFEHVVAPLYALYGLPTKSAADYVVDATGQSAKVLEEVQTIVDVFLARRTPLAM